MTYRDTLHFLTCGHVDDGKSTLIGRLLYDIDAIPEDQLQSAMVDGIIDYSRLTDGLEDERSQGITIDVAYRFFRYGGRHYRIADTPGHVQYVRNMAVAAANSDCALVLVDASHGVREQTVRHSRIAAFFGIRHFLVAVNKMDLVDYSQERFYAIETAYRLALDDLKELSLNFIPVSALRGDNLTERSPNIPWYNGASLLESLAAFEVPHQALHGARLPVQSVIRTHDHRRGYQGMLQGGRIRLGDWLHVATGEAISVTDIFHSGHPVKEALPGQAVTVLTNEDVDLSRGNVLYTPDAPMQNTDTFTADLLWLDPAFAHKNVTQGTLKIAHHEEQVEVHVDDTTPTIVEAKVFAAAPFAVDAYARNRATGLFLLIQSETEKVIGVGAVKSPQVREDSFSI